jgi:hypothetical protein
MKRTIKSRNQRIDDDQDHELTYWSEKLGVPRDRLREAVVKVGSMRKAVEQQQRWRRLGLRKRQSDERGPPDFSILRAAADELGITSPKAANRPRRKGPIRVKVLKGRH